MILFTPLIISNSSVIRTAPAMHAKLGNAFTIDARQSISHISPYIYGADFPNWASMPDGYTFARFGGNRCTAYNWETNASNAGSDYHNQNDNFMSSSSVAALPITQFVQGAQANHAAALITVPTQGHVSADENPPGDVNLTPNYLNVRFLKSYSTKPGGNFVYPPNTADGVVYQDEFVHYMETVKTAATPLWYSLDNEPDIWSSTHSRIQLTPLTYAALLANSIDFSGAIKNVAPNTLVFGPANYGWEGFRTLQNAPDANGRDFLNFYLAGMNQASQTAGHRLLDVLDIHWYPEATGDGIRITDNSTDPAVAAARIQAPRSLWDPTYVETSWITQSLGNKPIALLPGIQQQITNNYPGTKFSISEYNYGGGSDYSGLLAQADVLGIFGRYQMFAAANWGISPNDVAMRAAFRAYENYDGHGAKVGDLVLRVSGTTAAENSVYAMKDSIHPNQITVVVINKTPTPALTVLGVLGFVPLKGAAYSVTPANFNSPTSTAISVFPHSAQFFAPADSVTTVLLSR